MRLASADLHQGDCLAVIPSLDDVFDAVITDPAHSSGGQSKGNRAASTGAKYLITGRVQWTGLRRGLERPAQLKKQHVVKRDDGGAVRGAGNQRDTSHRRPQSEAERAARDIAINQHSEVLIHGGNGRIREHSSYGNDLHPPKG